MVARQAVLCLLVACGASAYGAQIGPPAIVDSVGIPIIDHVNPNQKIHVSANISNHEASSQDFVYIVQITDHGGTIVLLKWFGGEADEGQQLDIAVSWTPEAPGTYTVDVFLWDGLRTQNALDAKESTTITVN